MPFTSTEFFDVFRRYNESVFPAQIALTVLGLTAMALTFRSTATASRWVSGILALLWLWMGVVYHLLFFTTINPLAWAFAGMFLVQVAAFVAVGVWRGRIRFEAPRDSRALWSAGLLLYAFVGYPALGLLLGHRYPTNPTFGLPCPTTIFTFGLLLLADRTMPRWMFAIPMLWAIVGTVGAVTLRVPEDLGLAVAAIVTAIVAIRRHAEPARGATTTVLSTRFTLR